MVFGVEAARADLSLHAEFALEHFQLRGLDSEQRLPPAS